MTSVLICADTVRSPELRHEVPTEIGDPFLYAEANGRRYAVVSQLDADNVRAHTPGIEVIEPESLGIDELIERFDDREDAIQEVIVRGCERIGITDAAVPGAFPVDLADRLRAAGLELTPDRRLFEGRRRAKNAAELEGIVRAQRAAEAGMAAVAELLRSAEVGDGLLLIEGEPLTSERLKEAIADALSSHAVICEEPIASHGPQTAAVHEHGSGPIAPGEPVVIDLWPQDRASACFADMTRTFVVGDVPDEIREWHALCREALDRATQAIRPGIKGREIFELVCDLFHEHSLPTQLSKRPGEALREGFFHSLGHGVGLEVHEAPGLGRTRADEIVAGDVLAVEPGLYRPDIGGVRLEDIVRVTDDGAETITSFPYELKP